MGSAISLRSPSRFSFQSSKSKSETAPFSRSTSRPQSRLTQSNLGHIARSQSAGAPESRPQSGIKSVTRSASGGTTPVVDMQPLSAAKTDVSRQESALFFTPGERPRTSTGASTPGAQSGKLVGRL